MINPVSFAHKSDIDDVTSAIDNTFRRVGDCRYAIHISRYPRDAAGVIRRYIGGLPERQPVRVYAVGGDGILFDCLNAVVRYANAELASVPYGYENDFVRAFGEGVEDTFRNIRNQAFAPSIPTDVIVCDGNYALNYCSVGVESMSTQYRVAMIRRFPKLRSLFMAPKSGLYVISTYLAVFSEGVRNQYYNIMADGEKLDGIYSVIHIANGPCYGKSMTPSGESLPDDGLLEFYVGRKFRFIDAVRFLPVLGYGGHTNKRYEAKNIFHHQLIRGVDISSDEPLLVVLDGEVYYDTSVKIRIAPGAVRIVAPNGMRYSRRMPSDTYGNTTYAEKYSESK